MPHELIYITPKFFWNVINFGPGLTTPEFTFLAWAFISFLIEVNLRQESRVIPKRWKNVDPVLAQNFLPWAISFKWIAFILRQDSYVIPIRAKNGVGVVVEDVVVIVAGGVVIMMVIVAGVVVIVCLVRVTVRKWKANHLSQNWVWDPYWSALDFWKMDFKKWISKNGFQKMDIKKWISTNSILGLLWVLLPVQSAKFKFEIDQKWS